MTQEEIIVFNKRCAEVVGAEYNPEDNRYTFQKELTDTEYTLRKSKRHHREQMCFHSDWNWIHEVIDAIEKLKYVVKIITSPTLSGKWTQHTIKIQNHMVADIFNDKFIVNYTSDYGNNESKKEAVVQAINQFLIRYNENKNN